MCDAAICNLHSENFEEREMRHRSKNLVAMIQSIARLTLRDCAPSTVNDFTQRIAALGDVQTLSYETDSDFLSAMDILRRMFTPFSGRLTLQGDDAILPLRTATRFALVVHELTANAVKHGALSSPDGRITVSLATVRDAQHWLLNFYWQEVGGPAVSQPEHRGFGTRVLLQIGRSISKHVRLEYEPYGLRYELAVQVARADRDDGMLSSKANRPKSLQ